uniref:Uncharacterized protein n=1 Tax=Lepeophtheirus salmonis TaxID=72036 RepID=A0A0K2UK10_LEPSM
MRNSHLNSRFFFIKYVCGLKLS